MSTAESSPIKVIQWATGGVGRAGIQGVLARSDLELVGVWVHSDDKVGRDAALLADPDGDLGLEPTGVTATSDVEALLALEADAVIYAPFLPDDDTVARILTSGANVATPLNWFYRGARDWDALDAAARSGGSTLHGTGIHPGGITERFPLMLSALSASVTHVRAEEFSDIRTYGAPDVVGDIMLFGRTPEEASSSIMPAVLTDGFGQSIDMVAAALGVELDGPPVCTHEVSTSSEPVDSPIGVIEPGRITAQRFAWEGMVGGVPLIEVRTNWFMGTDGFEAGWTFGPEGERFEIQITGDPSTTTVVHGLHPESIAAGLRRNPGVVATANHVVSAVPAVVAARPGIVSYLDLPLVAGRAERSFTG